MTALVTVTVTTIMPRVLAVIAVVIVIVVAFARLSYHAGRRKRYYGN